MTAAALAGQRGRTPGGRTPRTPLRVAVRPAPLREPPFDDELPERGLISGRDPRLPFEPAPIRNPRHLGARNRLPDPGPWARRLLVGLIESAEGRRSLAQLASLLSFSVGRGLGAELERSAQAGHRHWLHRAEVRSVRATEPADGVAELCATLDTGARVRAVAMRLEQRHGRWQCTRLQLG